MSGQTKNGPDRFNFFGLGFRKKKMKKAEVVCLFEELQIFLSWLGRVLLVIPSESGG